MALIKGLLRIHSGRGRLYGPLIALFMSIPLRWTFRHLESADYQAWSFVCIAITGLLVVGIRVILAMCQRIDHTLSGKESYQTSLDWLHLSLLAFVLGAVLGSIVSLYVVLCYLAFSPLFLDKQNTIHLDSLLVATAFGLLAAGLLYVFSAVVGINGAVVVPIVFFGLAAINLWKFRVTLLPRVALSKPLAEGVALLLFLAFSGAALVGSVMMGMGDYPQVFFNIDTPLRLTHAHEILGLTEFPQESLTTKGIYRSYHYGGPAAAATLSAITGLHVHKSQFLAVSPLLLVGSFSAVWLLCRSILSNRIHQMIAVALFLPFVGLGMESYYRYIYTAQVHGMDVLVKFMDGFLPIDFSDSDSLENFGGGVWNISQIASIFVLLCAAVFLTQRKTLYVAVAAPLLVLLTVFSRIAFMPAVSVLLGIRLAMSWRYYTKIQIFWYVVISAVIGVLALKGLGVFGAVAGSVTLKPADDIWRSLSWMNEKIWNRQEWLIVEVLSVLLGSLIYARLYFIAPAVHREPRGIPLVIGALTSIIFCYVVVTVLDVQDINQAFRASWIAVPLVAVALMSLSGQTRFHGWVVTMVITPVLLIGLMGQWQKMQQLAVTVLNPEAGHEYSDNTILAEALATIPKKDSVIVTNDFRYLRLRTHQTPITGTYGHQAYAVDSNWIAHDKEMLEQANEKINQQKALLSSLFNRSQTRFSAHVKTVARNENWTHFLLKKDTVGWIWRSPTIFYTSGQESKALEGTPGTQNRQGAIIDRAPVMIKHEDLQSDRVRCARGGMEPDGAVDNVFTLDVFIPENQLSNSPTITLIELRRDDPPGMNHTSNHNFVLGVSDSIDGKFLNGRQGRLQIPIDATNKKLWLFACADGHDGEKSRYFARLTFAQPLTLAEYDSVDDIPLKKTFENDKYAVFEF